MIGSTNLNKKIGINVNLLQVNILTDTIIATSDTVIKSINNAEIMKNEFVGPESVEFNIPRPAWRLGISTLSNRYDIGGCGISHNAKSFGGVSKGTTMKVGTTENCDGMSWILSNGMHIGRSQFGSCGISNSALAISGAIDLSKRTDTTEKNDGLSWSYGSNMLVAIDSATAVGNSNNALFIGGTDGRTSDSNYNFYKFDGNTWSSGGKTSIRKTESSSSGNANNALAIGGYTGGSSQTNIVEYIINGIASTAPSMIEERSFFGGDGTINSSIVGSGGTGAPSITTEIFNSIVWIMHYPLNYGRTGHAMCGSTKDSLIFGGINSENYAVTEIFEFRHNVTVKSLYIKKILPEKLLLKKNQSVKIFEIYHGVASAYRNEWISKPLLNNAREDSSGCGNLNNSLIAGGTCNALVPLNAILPITELFNGSVWSVSANMNIARTSFAISGSPSSSLAFGGDIVTEVFNYVVWSTKSNLNTLRVGLVGSGNGASAVAICGVHNDTTDNVSTESTLGAVWRSGNNININRMEFACVGSGMTNTLIFGGMTVDIKNRETLEDDTEILKNEVWSISTKMNRPTSCHTGCGNTGSALSIGGIASNNVDEFIGNVWSTSKPTLTHKYNSVGCGTSSNALASGGRVDLVSNLYTEAFMRIPFNKGEWKIFSNLNKSRDSTCGVGNGKTNALIIGGGSPSSNDDTNSVEKLLINTWTTVNGLLTNRSKAASAGTVNNAIIFGGGNENESYLSRIEIYNGNVWSNHGYSDTASVSPSGCGPKNNAIVMGGSPEISYKRTRLYNGSVWSAGPDMNTGSVNGSASGNASNTLLIVGLTSISANTLVDSTAKFNGLTWNTSASKNITTCYISSSGTSSNAMSINGNRLNVTEKFDNLIWNISDNTNIDRSRSMGCGSVSNTIIAGGYSYTEFNPGYDGLSSEQYTMSNSIFTNLPIVDIITSNPVTLKYSDV